MKTVPYQRRRLYQIKSRYRSWQIRERWQFDDDTQLLRRRTCRDGYFFSLFFFSLFFSPSPRVSVISVSPNAARKYKRTGSREWVNSARSILKNSYVCVNKSYVQDECVIIYSVNGQVSIVCGYTWSDEELVRCLGDGRIFWKGFFFVNCKNFNIDF